MASIQATQAPAAQYGHYGIPPPWYKLQTTRNGNAYIALPAQPGRPPVFLTSFFRHDAVMVQKVLSHPSINDRLIAVPTPYTIGDAEEWIDLQLSGKSGLPLQVIRADDPDRGYCIGAVSLLPSIVYGSLLHDIDENRTGEYALGYYLNPDFRGMGIMRDAVLAELAWASAEQGVKQVVVCASVMNPASVKLIECLPGFKLDGDGKEVEWPEPKGGGKQVLLTWRWKYDEQTVSEE